MLETVFCLHFLSLFDNAIPQIQLLKVVLVALNQQLLVVLFIPVGILAGLKDILPFLPRLCWSVVYFVYGTLPTLTAFFGGSSPFDVPSNLFE